MEPQEALLGVQMMFCEGKNIWDEMKQKLTINKRKKQTNRRFHIVVANED